MSRSEQRTRRMTAAMLAVVLLAGVAHPQTPSSHARVFENDYVKMTVEPGWTTIASIPGVKLTHGKYVLDINSVFVHASGVGRLDEIIGEMPSVKAVMANVEGPWPTSCAQADVTNLSGALSLANLYTDKSMTGQDCTFPSDDRPAWFGSYLVGEGSESAYTITLAYDSADVNALPKRGSRELQGVLSEVDAMLKTLVMKPPILITSIEPQSAAPGAGVTLRGTGFNLASLNEAVSFKDFPNTSMLQPKIAADGKSVTFTIPTSLQRISCPQPGYIEVGEDCVQPPPNYVEVNECPRPPQSSAKPVNFCAVPFPPGTYQIWVTGSMVRSNAVTLRITEPPTTPVVIALMYPTYGLVAGTMITVRGVGFTRTGNTMKIGDAVVRDVASADGKTLVFAAPSPAPVTASPAIWEYQASVGNSNGESNSILVNYAYRPQGGIQLQWQPGGWRYQPKPATGEQTSGPPAGR